ncbi:MAG: N-methyl-L-tryptophan oxidase [Anaerolineae bacterium]|nr:N-methyl-L-tryptophan oxidase [Anaerolineae bacterium]
MNATHYDTIVLGAGALGSAAAYHLAKRSQRVLVVEQFEIDHQKGSSHGHSRIIRYAYSHVDYVELARAVYPEWTAFEAEAGERLYTRTGGIDFGRPEDSGLQTAIQSLRDAGIPHEVWTAREARKQFPQFHLDEDMQVLYQADAGILSASRCVRAHVRLAERRGAVIHSGEAVTSIHPSAQQVTVKTSKDTYSSERLVIAGGSWMRSLLVPLGLDLPLTPMRCQEIYFDTDQPGNYLPDRFPTFIAHMEDAFGRKPYGIASHHDSGLKIAFHGGERVSHPDEINYTPDTEEVERALSFSRRYLPGVRGLRSTRICLYTMTPDEDWIIDYHPSYPNIVIAGGCSGHAFKFSTLIGRILTEMLLDGHSSHRLERFRMSRFLTTQSS